ncbi:DUF3303 family protein [Oceaniglobus roseus]|uniref:DUF3303 family protein n=1 Tax=Oceaniglobus roseus TaxID=1737570 RepID=UPI000C7F63EB|nr:DUF3303 family protein [Kandeliimicrobium roseum]
MQLLIRHKTTDPAAWRRFLDDDRENQGKAGLSMLQLWTDAGDPNTFWALFEVSDRDEAQPWVDAMQGGLYDDRAGITGADYHFLNTA